MCSTCGCKGKKSKKEEKPVRYQCTCAENCDCPIIEFDKEPDTVPYCCGLPMKRIK